MKKPGADRDRSPSTLISQRIAALGDWRGTVLAKIRALIHDADDEIFEELWRARASPRRRERADKSRNGPGRIGRGDWIRTSDFSLPKRALYQAELRPDAKDFQFYFDLPRPPADAAACGPNVQTGISIAGDAAGIG
jgi:hypothetical protein